MKLSDILWLGFTISLLLVAAIGLLISIDWPQTVSKTEAEAPETTCPNDSDGDGLLVVWAPCYDEYQLNPDSIAHCVMFRVKHEVVYTKKEPWKAVSMGVNPDRKKVLFSWVEEGKIVWSTDNVVHAYILLGL